MRRQNQSLADFGIADVASFWLLYTINSFLPAFRHVYETRRGHPVALYETMLELAGALTTFSMRVHPARSARVRGHDELAGCFTKLDAQLRELLETVVPATTVSIPLPSFSHRASLPRLDQDKYLAAPQIFLALSASGRANELVQRVPQLLR
jgi:type VI secretion system protein ImpJ